MNHRIQSIVAAVAVSLAGTALAETPVNVNLQGQALPQAAEATIRAKAEQGIAALRQYVQRTRGIYQLRLAEIVR